MTRSRKRRLLRRTVVSAPIAAVLFATTGLPAAPDTTIETSADPSTVRVLTGAAALTGGMFQGLIADFEAESGYDVTLTVAGQDIMDRARRSEGDIVLIHLGFTPLNDFVTDGRGMYPATVLSNSVALLIPPGDPARVRKLDDPFEAFEAIAETESPFIVNNLGETLYITNTLYNAAGRPDPGDWFIDLGQSGPPAVIAASQRGAYTLWGLHPFLNLRVERDLNLEAVIYNDSIMQRIMATTVVRRPPGQVNEEGALALQDFLTDPATQAEIRRFRLGSLEDHPDIDEPIFWPAGNQNDN
ncbi:MAG: hypothetical protein GEV03_27775 [Streptosporangiales bacterium]|nr:hypothetical protein [Streptosporangiales bacterium]